MTPPALKNSPPARRALMATFFFRAVASDGKIRSGSLSGDNERLIARELRKQGLTPVYVGVAPKSTSIEFELPHFGGAAEGCPLLHPGNLHPADRRRAARPRHCDHRRADRSSRLPFHRPRRLACAEGRPLVGRQPGHAPGLLLRSVYRHGAGGRSQARWPASSNAWPISNVRATNCGVTSSRR